MRVLLPEMETDLKRPSMSVLTPVPPIPSLLSSLVYPPSKGDTFLSRQPGIHSFNGVKGVNLFFYLIYVDSDLEKGRDYKVRYMYVGE